MVQKKTLLFICPLIAAAIISISSCSKESIQQPNGSNFSSTKYKNLARSVVATSPTGTILREEWDGVSGYSLANIPVQNPISSSEQITTMSWPSNYVQNYGDRIRGYIYPPVTGNYTFWISGDDASSLYLSTDDNPSNKTQIASNSTWVGAGIYNKFASQQSVPIALQANKKYYIEALHAQGGGSSSVSVQWQLPNQVIESPIPGSRLSPFVTAEPTGTILREEWDGVSGYSVANIPLQNPVSSIEQITTMSWPSNFGQNYGDRIRGYIYPPVTGNYTFWISGDDASSLYLSTDDSPSNKTQIASNSTWVGGGIYNKFPSQQSVPIALQANKKYYIEALHAQGGGSSSVSVQWQLPNQVIESPIPGSRLSPFVTAATTYTPSGAVFLNGQHDLTISGLSIIGDTLNPILITNCYNIHITQNKLYNSKKEGIYICNCYNITVDYNYITNVSTGVEVVSCSAGGINVNNNQFLNMTGPMPRGQFIGFDEVGGAGNSISYNKCVNILGQSYPEDAINIFESNGTPASPINIVGNWIRGGGPSVSGGGILLGDSGGSYLYAANNLLVNPGAYGMQITAGDHNSIINNFIYASAQYFTNVGIDQWAWQGMPITNSTITGNYVNFTNSANQPNNDWLGTGTATGWANNTWGANISSSILPPVLLTDN